MPFSVFPKFRATSAVLSSKIDAVIREIAALLNGGLSIANIKPGTAFPLVAFTESKGAFALRVANVNVDMTLGVQFGAIPIACRLIGAGAKAYGTGWFIASVGLQSSAGGYTFLGSIPLAQANADGSFQGVKMFDPPLAIAAGDVLAAGFPSNNSRGEVVLFFDTDHQG
jgi:hypothetical protein